AGDRKGYSGGDLDQPDANGAMIIATSTVVKKQVTTWRSRTAFNSLTDGLSNTILVGEKHVLKNHFGEGYLEGDTAGAGDGSVYNGDWHRNFARVGGPGFRLANGPTDLVGGEWKRVFGSYHPGICQFVMADGSVQAIPTSIPVEIYRLLIVRNDGQPIPN